MNEFRAALTTMYVQLREGVWVNTPYSCKRSKFSANFESSSRRFRVHALPRLPLSFSSSHGDVARYD
jgi:hypothetical protein